MMMISQQYPWLATIWQQLSDRWQQQRFPHALLIQGLRGLGKLQLAQALTRHMLCERGAEGCDRENLCRSCQLMEANNHPDWRLLAPEKQGKAIKIDEVREAIQWVQLSPLRSRYKVLIISPAEAMNVAASNALLKTLEEPPANTFLILLSEQPQRLLATIRSRCQKWIITADRATISAWLAAQSKQAITYRPEGIGPLAILAEMEDQSGEVRVSWHAALQQLQQHAVDFLTVSQKFAKAEPMICLDGLAEFLYQQMQQASSPSMGMISLYEEALKLKQQLLKGANFNWQLQLESLLQQFCAKAR